MKNDILNLIKKNSRKYNIPFDVLYSVIMTESEGNPLAKGKEK